jgi:aminopeptidase N
LKATFKARVRSPSDWVLISNENVVEKQEEGEVATWEFAETKRISSYLFTLVAGPYKRLDFGQKLRDITFSCYCRESLLPHLEKL